MTRRDEEMNRKEVKVRVGKGYLSFSQSVFGATGGFPLVLEIEKSRSPCTDTSCQIIAKLVVRRYEPSQDADCVPLTGSGIPIYISREAYDSIDRGRQEVSILTTIGKRVVAKNYTYVS